MKRWCLLTLVLLLSSCSSVPEQPVSRPVSALPSLPDYSAEQKLDSSSEAASSEETLDPRLAELAALHEQNNNLAGWITIPDIGIDFPVMQRDNSFYLTHGFDGELDKNGLPFMDSRCLLREGMFSVNTLIYGHNMDGQVFRDLIFYRELDYYKEHPFVTFDTIHDLGQWVIFACFEANTEPRFGPVFEYYNFINDHDPTQIQWYLDEVRSRSFFLSPVEVTTEDILLTLQICANDRYETKVCVAARRLREDETPDSFDFESTVENLERMKTR